MRKPGPPVHDDLLAVIDPTGEGKLYLCAVKDCYSGRIVGYAIDSRMKSALAASSDPQRDHAAGADHCTSN